MTSSEFPVDATLADVGEFGLISRFVFPQGDHVLIGPGDDAAVLRSSGHIVVSVDMAVENRHFRRDWTTARDIGRKVAAAALADIAAMGGQAESVVVGLGSPRELSVQWALDFASGIGEECAVAGASVVGGDLTMASEIVASITVLGRCDHAPVTRAGAIPGHVVALCGRQGWAAAGLAVLSRGFRSPRAVVSAYARPEPPYAEGPRAAAAGASAMIDVSDGLLADLGHVASASGVHIDLRRDALAVDEPLQTVGAALGVDPQEFVLTGGDDHPLAACFPPESVPDGWRVIGTCHEGEPAVHIDGVAHAGVAGHVHF